MQYCFDIYLKENKLEWRELIVFQFSRCLIRICIVDLMLKIAFILAVISVLWKFPTHYMHLILTIHLFFYFLALIYTHLNLLEKDRKKTTTLFHQEFQFQNHSDEFRNTQRNYFICLWWLLLSFEIN